MVSCPCACCTYAYIVNLAVFRSACLDCRVCTYALAQMCHAFTFFTIYITAHPCFFASLSLEQLYMCHTSILQYNAQALLGSKEHFTKFRLPIRATNLSQGGWTDTCECQYNCGGDCGSRCQLYGCAEQPHS